MRSLARGWCRSVLLDNHANNNLAAGISIVCARSRGCDGDDNVRNIIRRIPERRSDAGAFN